MKINFKSKNANLVSNNEFNGNCITSSVHFKESFYFLSPFERKIFITDQRFSLLKQIDTVKAYSCIHFDVYNSCFWLCGNNSSWIYCFDEDMNQIMSVDLSIAKQRYGKIVDVSSDDKDNLILCYSNDIIKINKFKPRDITVLFSSEAYTYNGIEKTFGYYYISYTDAENNYLAYYDQHLSLLGYEIIDDEIYRVKSVFSDRNKLFLLCNNSSKNLLVLAYFEKNQTQTYCFDSLVFANNTINKIEATDSKIAYNNIISSISLEESAISSILNAEGEKVVKSICLSNDICQMLKIGEKTSSLISSITALEQTLLMKLEIAKNLIELEVKKDKDN